MNVTTRSPKRGLTTSRDLCEGCAHMKVIALGRYVLGFCAIALFSACSGGGTQLASALPQNANGSSTPFGSRKAAPSITAPDFHIENDLLYVSDPYTGDVYVRTYPRNKSVEALTGFYPAPGMCSDSKGNVWVANPNYANIAEFTHGGTKIIATLNDPGQYPVSCAIDGKTGNLAAVNGTNASGGAGSLSIYKKARGNPTVIPAYQHTDFDGYDNEGNLFVDGSNGTASELGEVLNGRDVVTPLTLEGATLNFPGDIQYALGSLALGDQELNSSDSGIYRVRVTGSTAQVIGTVDLTNSNRVGPFMILGKTHRIICGDTSSGRVLIYDYPGGGPAIKTLNVLPSGTLDGLTLSVPSPSPGP